MKLIFLDIDGVLNTSNPDDTRETVGMPGRETVCYVIRDLVKNLNDLVHSTGALVVISSTWRKLYDLGEIQEVFRKAGFTAELFGMTPISPTGYRGLEIRDYLRDKSVENYIILDDDSDFLLSQAAHFFNIDQEFGLSKKTVYKASKFLYGVI